MIGRLDDELKELGVPSDRRRRIRLELEDHLACDPEADLGEPVALARQFADELGTAYARRGGFTIFLALVPLGVLFVALFALSAAYTTNADSGLILPLVLGTQIAFVGGTLGLLRAWRLRGVATVPTAEARILLRRAGLGLAGGATTVAAIATLASRQWLGPEWWAHPLAWITVGVGAASVLFGAVAVARAARLLPRADGTARDLSFDLGLNVDPWRIAILLAVAVALAIAADGAVAGDALDGLVRGFADALACLAGFALLGRPLGLRS
ncbi:MAG TPA: hypothetical protein VKR79_10300 [Gaiellaceae bacterium]|nr:hypothetical protein [Gaiellaceae bacterium]